MKRPKHSEEIGGQIRYISTYYGDGEGFEKIVVT